MREMVKSPSSAVAMRDLFVVVLLLHPTVSGMAMEFFRCRTIDGETYLMVRACSQKHSLYTRLTADSKHFTQADYSLTCYDGTWFAFLPLVLLVLLAYSIGTPVGIYLLLKARRAGLYDEHGKVISQPLDTVKANVQRVTPDLAVSTRQVARSVFRTRGFLGFFAGAAPAVSRAFLVSSTRFTVYEGVHDRLRRHTPPA